MTTTTAALHPLLASRRSPRAFDSTHELSDAEVSLLLEAARWAPSASNTQPWRFGVTHRGTAAHSALCDVLTGANRVWAPTASVLLVAAATVVSPEGKPRGWARYDTGQAVAHLTVQAEAMGLIVHQMAGFEPEPLSALLRLDSDGDVRPVTVVAVGRHDPSAPLPDALAARETQPRTRRPVADLLLEVHPAAASA